MTTWKGLTIFCVSFLCCFFAQTFIDLACGPEIDPYDYSISFFHNNLAGGKEYQPFYYNYNLFINDDNEPEREDVINSREWAAYLGKNVKTKDVLKAMYWLNSKADSILLRNYFNKKMTLPDSLRSNTFLRNIIQPANKAPLSYYVFVKKMERVTNEIYDNRWNPSPRDSGAMYQYGQYALKQALAAPDGFLKLRYFYQAQRLLHYSGHQKEAAKLYDRYIAGIKSKSHVKGWALALKAGEEWADQPAHAAYLQSKIFANYPERRISAYHDFHSIGIKPAEVLRFAKNNAEKANIYAVDGFHQYGLTLNPLKMVYRYQRSSKLVAILLCREINKIETGYLTPLLQKKLNYYYFDNAYFDIGHKTRASQYVAYMDQLKTFCKILCTDKNSLNAPLGSIAIAYLDWMQNRADDGLLALANLDQKAISSAYYDQAQMVKLLLLAKTIKHLDDSTEQKLLPCLQWLDVKMQQETKPDKRRVIIREAWEEKIDVKRFSMSGRDFYQKILAPLYLKQADTTKAALCMFKSAIDTCDLGQYHELYGRCILPDFFQNYLHSANLRKIINYKYHRPQNPYIGLLCSPLKTINKNFLYDLVGTACLREHNYTAAIKYLEKMVHHVLNHYKSNSNNNADYLKDDPFISRLSDYHQAAGKKKYNKLMFAKTMVRLQQQAKKSPQHAGEYYFKIATGLYNTSFYGNAWYLITYSWASNDRGLKNRFYFDDDYQRAKNAEYYFTLAAQAGKNPEFKACCTFMAAKCRQKQAIFPDYPKWIDNEKEYDRLWKIFEQQSTTSEKATRVNPYFDILKQQYANTHFFKAAQSECSYFRDFLHPKRVKYATKKVVIVR